MQEYVLNLRKDSESLWHLNHNLLLPPYPSPVRVMIGLFRRCCQGHQAPFLPGSQSRAVVARGRLPAFLIPPFQHYVMETILGKSRWEAWGSLPPPSPHSERESSTSCMAGQEYWTLAPACLWGRGSTPGGESQENQRLLPLPPLVEQWHRCSAPGKRCAVRTE